MKNICKDTKRHSSLTAAELMRRRLRNDDDSDVNNNKTDNNKQKIQTHENKEDSVDLPAEGDIDDEIKRLEAELADDSNDSYSGSDSESDEDENETNECKKSKIRFGCTTILNPDKEENKKIRAESRNKSEPAILCASKCADEKIVPLPKTALPQCKSKKLKIDYDGDDGNTTKSASKLKKRKRSSSSSSSNKDAKNNLPSDGLREAVLEVLQGYVPRSSERIPFYCRVCSHTSSNKEEFIAHKKTEFHKTAVQVEKKKTYCKLCRKQLTSLVQMQEHLQSKPHKEKLDFVQARQRGETGNYQDIRRQHSGERGRGGRGFNRKQPFQDGQLNKRQWC